MTSSELPLRSWAEIIIRHELHPELATVLTEGIHDLRFYRWHFQSLGLDLDFIHTGDIEKPEMQTGELRINKLEANSNRDLLIALTSQLPKDKGPRMVAIVDRDRSERYDSAPSNPYLEFTDYRDREAYALEERTFAKLLDVGCGITPQRDSSLAMARDLLAWLVPLLRLICALHDALDALEWGVPKVSLRKYLQYDGTTASLSLNKDGYVLALLSQAKRLGSREIFLAEAARLENLPGDHRYHVRGHTFLEVLEAFLSRRLAAARTGEAAGLCKGLLASVETSWLKDQPLFTNVMTRFNASVQGAGVPQG